MAYLIFNDETDRDIRFSLHFNIFNLIKFQHSMEENILMDKSKFNLVRTFLMKIPKNLRLLLNYSIITTIFLINL
jgi:hypothetical protein